MHPLDGVWLKVRRGRKHMKEAKRYIDRFRKSNPYTIGVEVDANSGEKRWIVDNVPKEPGIQLSGSVGDSIYNFRSALDHLAWQLVLANGESPTYRTAFPICSSPEEWAGSRTKSKIKGIHPKAIAILKMEQPCFSSHPYRKYWFVWLDELCNMDKHRDLYLTQAATGGGFWSHPLPMKAANETFIFTGPTKKGTILASVPQPYADVDFYPVFDIAFGQGTSAEGEIVYPTLFNLGFLVQSTIRLYYQCFPQTTSPRLHRFDIWGPP